MDLGVIIRHSALSSGGTTSTGDLIVGVSVSRSTSRTLAGGVDVTSKGLRVSISRLDEFFFLTQSVGATGGDLRRIATEIVSGTLAAASEFRSSKSLQNERLFFFFFGLESRVGEVKGVNITGEMTTWLVSLKKLIE
jgi:hypothetical protein